MTDMDKIKIRTIWKNHLVASFNISVVITHSQHVCVYIGRIHQTGDWLDKNKESNDHQEQAIDESGEDFNTTIPATNKGAVLEHPAWSYFSKCCCCSLPVGEDPGCFPAGHESSKQAQD